MVTFLLQLLCTNYLQLLVCKFCFQRLNCSHIVNQLHSTLNVKNYLVCITPPLYSLFTSYSYVKFSLLIVTQEEENTLSEFSIFAWRKYPIATSFLLSYVHSAFVYTWRHNTKHRSTPFLYFSSILTHF